MQPVLAFDTSAAHCAAALLRGDHCLTRIEVMGTGQAERLLPLLEEMLAEGGIGWRDLVAIGVGTGPGNFTGTRIAIAAARGLALALGIPAVGVSTPEALALGLGECTVVQDARRGMVQVQALADGVPSGPPHLLPADGPLPVGAGAVLVGDMAAVVGPRLGARVADPLHPLAKAIALIARERMGSAPARPAPVYLRAADAAPPRDPPPRIIPG
ncbi:MAG: tRNA (adenosine(37)-N6)-threonylcarbamoyltransferase complex dimerization subunit type 1 TsaB [Rubellimicrobium sp.]|nr:tRNA (adenosine(37)-N6)-threonylcarbamoyltransferase complex dimerization subunit type 1 TsaB [Rubellimicrobium sp.]